MNRVFSPLQVAVLSASLLAALGATAQTATTTDAVAPASLTGQRHPGHVARMSSQPEAPKADLTTAIALAGLANENVTDPSADQLNAAVSNVQFLRASGMRWSAVANTLGVRLSSVIGQMHDELETSATAAVKAREEVRRVRVRLVSQEPSLAKDKATLLAMASLAKQDVAEPTADQVSASLANVQALRDSGLGWGAIANSLGLRLGDVVSASRSSKERPTRSRLEAHKSDQKHRTHALNGAMVASTAAPSVASGERSGVDSDSQGVSHSSAGGKSGGQDSAGQRGSGAGLSGGTTGSSSGNGRSGGNGRGNGGGGGGGNGHGGGSGGKH